MSAPPGAVVSSAQSGWAYRALARLAGDVFADHPSVPFVTILDHIAHQQSSTSPHPASPHASSFHSFRLPFVRCCCCLTTCFIAVEIVLPRRPMTSSEIGSRPPMTLDHDNKLPRLQPPFSPRRVDRVQPLGGVRCYWALLVPTYNADASGQSRLELKFAYLDPVLSTHLGPQNAALTDHGVIEFIHEAERERECHSWSVDQAGAWQCSKTVAIDRRSSSLSNRQAYMCCTCLRCATVWDILSHWTIVTESRLIGNGSCRRLHRTPTGSERVAVQNPNDIPRPSDVNLTPIGDRLDPN